MKRFLFVALLAFLVFPIGFSLECNSVDNYVTNLAYAANVGKISFDVALNSLKVFQPIYTNCTDKGILLINSLSTYSYSVNGTYVGAFSEHILLLQKGTYNITAGKEGYLSSSKLVSVTGWNSVNFVLIKGGSTGSSAGGVGPAPNTFYKVDKSSILNYMDLMASEINLTSSDLNYQKQVYNKVPFELKYITSPFGSANEISYYFVNKWSRPVNVTIVVVIPKSVSKSLNGVALTSGYKVIKNDPIVTWNFEVNPNSTIKFGYTVQSNTTVVEPPIILFNNVNLESNTPQPQPKPPAPVQPTPAPKPTPEPQNHTQRNYTAPKLVSPHKSNNLMLYIGVAVIIAVAIGVTSIFFIRRKREYSELEEALDSLDKFVKTRRRR